MFASYRTPPILQCAGLALMLSGCLGTARQVRIEPAQVKAPEKEKIAGLTTLKGEEVLFDLHTGYYQAGMVRGDVKRTAYTIPLDQVQRLWLIRQNVSKTRTTALVAGTVVGAAVVFVAIVAAAVSSSGPAVGCPFVYSWNGHEYVFDGEMYGGSITKSMERDDYTELPHLTPDGGRYKLALANEMEETEYTNRTELWIVDHPRNSRVAAEELGKLHILSGLRPPTLARDETGKDVLPALRAADDQIWQTTPGVATNGSVRGEIVMTFPRPDGAASANLVVNGGTAPWGIRMITELFSLYGNRAEQTLAALDTRPRDLKALQAWSEREDVYLLRVWVKEPSGWRVRGVIPGGGANTRVIPLDLSRVYGDQVQIRIQPPNGFWALNSFAMDYGENVPVAVTKVNAGSARTSTGTDISQELSVTDGSYYVASKGDRAELEFPVPPPPEDKDRTVFLHSRGYYRPTVNAEGDADSRTLHSIFRQRGGLARFAALRYAASQPAPASHQQVFKSAVQ